MKARRLVLTAVALMFGATAFADEGMWMIQDINEALEKNMRARGLKLAANEIYNDEAPGRRSRTRSCQSDSTVPEA